MNEKEEGIYDDCNWKNSQLNNANRVLEQLKLALSRNPSPVVYTNKTFPNTPLLAERFDEAGAWSEKYFNEMKPKIIQEQVNVVMSGNSIGGVPYAWTDEFLLGDRTEKFKRWKQQFASHPVPPSECFKKSTPFEDWKEGLEWGEQGDIIQP